MIALVFVILFGFFILIHAKHKSPLKAASANMTLGTISLIAAALTVGAAVNVYTMFVALTLGVPGGVLIAVATLFLK